MPAYSPGAPGGGLLEIGVALVLQDRFSQPAREANRSIKQLHNDAKAVVSANINMANRLTNQFSKGVNFAWNMVANAIDTGANFIDTMTQVSAITQATNRDFDALVSQAQSLGYKTMFESRDIASGMKYLAMAGHSAQEIKQIINSATNIAGATGLELGGKGGAADLLTNVMRTFQVEGEKGAEMLGDEMVKATLSSNISITDLAESIKYAGAAMTTYKKDFPEVAAAIGTLGNAGIQGSMAGTSLANMVMYLNRALTKEGDKGYKMLHDRLKLTSKDFLTAEGNMKSFRDMLELINQATANMSSTERGTVFETLFGKRGMRAAVALSQNLDSFSNIWTRVMNSGGTAAEIMQKRMETLPGAINKIKSAAENLFTKFTITLAPTLAGIMDKMASFIDKMSNLFGSSLVSGVVLLTPLLFKLLVPIVKLAITIKDIRNTGLVTFRSMFSILFSGWKGASLSAAESLRIVTAINAQSMGMGVPTGILGKGAIRQKQKAYTQVLNNMPAGYFVGNARGGGKGIYRSRPGGKPPIFIGRVTDAYGNIATNKGGTQLAGGAKWVESRLGSAPKPGQVPRMMSHPAGKGVFSPLPALGTSLKSLASGIWTFLGGPVGIGITAISIILPMIVGGIRKRNEATIANNIALAKNTEATNRLAGRYENEAARMAAGQSLSYQEVLTLINNHLGMLVRLLSDPNRQDIKISIGDKEVPVSSLGDVLHDYGVKY